MRVFCVRSSADVSIQPPTLKVQQILRMFSVLLAFGVALAAQAQYTKIVVFGDSLSDTGNDLVLSETYYGLPLPGPPVDYTLGRFTDGPDTVPRAMLYFGVWVEQLAKSLPSHPPVTASLQGGTNYAFGYAKTGSGTTALSFEKDTIYVENIGQQVDDYLATHPKVDSHTLFVVWGGANDVLEASSAGEVFDAATDLVGNIQKLIHAGATQFLIPNLPPLGLIPEVNTSASVAKTVDEATVLYNTTLDTGVDLLPWLNFGRHLTIHKLDVYSLMKGIVASPGSYELANVTNSSQGVPWVDPDMYLFWDEIHPTTRGHNLVGQAALKAIEPRGCLVEVSALPLEYVGSSAAGCR